MGMAFPAFISSLAYQHQARATEIYQRAVESEKSLAQEAITDQPESRPTCTKVLTSGVMCCADTGRKGGGGDSLK